MKNFKYILLAIIAGVMILSACKKDATTSQYDNSLKAWNNYKAKVNNSYAYTTTFSPLTDVNNKTTITVTNGTITARDFYSYSTTYDPSTKTSTQVVASEWHEQVTTVGTHTDPGATLYTIDDLYAIAKNSWLGADKSKNTVYFETNNNGIISKAGYVPNGCQEGCFIGTQIISIKP